jgi:hypothetical protein
VERTTVASSTIASIGYDGGERILEVEFRNGHIYRYFLVPPLVHRSLMAADSKGTFLNARVKGSFGFMRL